MLEHAFRPGRIGRLALPHRVVMGSMHLGLEARPDGGAALAAFYAERARNGAGLIVTGGSAVSRVGAGGRNYSFIDEPAEGPKLARVAAAVHEAGGLVALQLFHAGRYAFQESFGLQPVAPSAVPSRFSRAAPAALSEEQIAATIADFARGAARARELGFDAVEVMASEGYLLNQFLSPLTNRRDDAWGGDAERRGRFGLAVLRALREAVGDAYPIIFRISGADLMDGSTGEEEVLAFAQRLAAAGVDALNVGVGWHESTIPTVQHLVPPGVWVRYAAAVKAAVGAVPVIASNRVNRLDLADRILASGAVDYISMARPFLADAAIVAKSRRGAAHLVNTCIACNQACIDRSLVDEPVSCMVNPRAGRETEQLAAAAAADLPRATARAAGPRRFAVVGGGPAGMEAARVLAECGRAVELFEAADALGGQFRLARRVPGKEDYGETIRYFTNELARLGVTVHLQRPLTGADAGLLAAFDGVVLATGVLPRRVALPGADLPHVLDYVDAFAPDRVRGQRVAIIGGGGIGVDLAHLLSHGQATLPEPGRFLVEQGLAPAPAEYGVAGGRQVTIMRRHGKIGDRLGRSTRWAVLQALRRQGVRMLTGVAYERITPEGVQIVDVDGVPRLIEADAVVIAAGQERNAALVPLLSGLGVPYRVVGGAQAAAELDAVRAFEEGWRAAAELEHHHRRPKRQHP